ncbi:1088_t:CDS:2 [Acaulospora colombiana]|uniref:1088_t:CDS:1 n=1 Tax=Acaulospora colombiana TaxID=27376 RepID=A0ACA9N2I0_9GLOM|nr:1088_t:CDS:2 [Acaulospora colombiana]
MSEQVAAAKLSNQVEQGGVLAKLLAFSFLLAVVPISAYFGTQWYITPAAVLSANLILVGYVIVAVREDSQAAKLTETKKDQ